MRLLNFPFGMNYIFMLFCLSSSILSICCHDHKRASSHSLKKHRRGATKRIIGGPLIPIKKAKFMGALILKVNNEDNDQNNMLCGVTIVGKKFALTVASCLDQVAVRLIKNGNVFIRSNTTSWSRISGTKVDHGITDYRKHENYKGEINNFDYNVAIIKVKREFTELNEKMIAIADPKYQYVDYAKASVYGWGMVDPDYESWQDKLMTVQLKLHSVASCRATLKNLLSVNLNDHEICTLGRTDADFCVGDEGGPLVQNDTAIGLMSWNPRCADNKFPSIYIKLSSFRDWIFEQIKHM